MGSFPETLIPVLYCAVVSSSTSCWSSGLSRATRGVPSSSSKALMVLRMDLRSTSKCDSPCSCIHKKEVKNQLDRANRAGAMIGVGIIYNVNSA